jgi:hypothetical protein
MPFQSGDLQQICLLAAAIGARFQYCVQARGAALNELLSAQNVAYAASLAAMMDKDVLMCDDLLALAIRRGELWES